MCYRPGTARFASPLGVYDFQKRTSVVQMSADGASALSEVTDTFANRRVVCPCEAAELRGGANTHTDVTHGAEDPSE